MTSQRADLALVQRGFFASRAKAQEAIAAGRVKIDGRVLSKAAEPVAQNAAIEAEPLYPWVSRGGVKLAAALNAFGFPEDAVCLDLGASTGGFTHVLLARGAAKVYAIDVGHSQLHETLRGDPRIVSREGTDARHLHANDFPEPPNFITCDLSFISLKLVLPSIFGIVVRPARLVCLIKPQFEVGPAHVVKGIVKDEAQQQRACTEIEDLIRGNGWEITGLIPSPISGGDGNREFLLGAQRS
ncbi:MAG: TlyA family RNA methyltransferase [Methylovirgula sp.]|uniref:TlyA family RNA methyltransferase n=1 Tax=Methylovirgula sp. TaxID=1978224 RepID=UPI00307661DD